MSVYPLFLAPRITELQAMDDVMLGYRGKARRIASFNGGLRLQGGMRGACTGFS